MATTGGNAPSGGPTPSSGPGSAREVDVAKDGLLAIAPRDASGRPTLGGIPLFKKLGQGGMGAVYLGKHPRLGIEVAVKVLPFHLADQDPNSIEYFMREAQSMARLNHPNLVRIYDVNCDGDPAAGSAIWFLVMELVTGKTAGGLIRERVKAGAGPLSEFEALDLMIAASEGLAAAHDEHFIHRDIKPDNIIIPLDKSGAPMLNKAKIMDLGLAKAASEDPAAIGLTGTNIAMGTPGYMAPEQAESAKSVGQAADVFSMGGTLYTLLTGSSPFTGNTVLTVLKKTTEEPHVPLKTLNGKVSEPTAVCVDTCLSKKPGDRYANAGILRDALKVCRDSLQGDATAQMTLMSLKNFAAMKPPPEPLSSDIVTMKATPVPPMSKSGPVPPAQTGPNKKVLAIILVVLLLLIGGAGIVAVAVFGKPPIDSWRTEAKAAETTNPARAIELYEKILKELPQDAPAKAALAALRAKGGSDDYDRFMNQGKSQESLSNWDGAEQSYVKAQQAKDTPDVVAALVRVRDNKTAGSAYLQKFKAAEVAFEAEQYADAERLYGEALNLRKNSEAAKSGAERSAKMKVEKAEADAILKDVAATGDPDAAWTKLQAGIRKLNRSYDLRMKSAEMALEKATFSWLGTGLDDAIQAEKIADARPEKKKAAADLRGKLEKKKAEGAAAAGALVQVEEAIKGLDWARAEELLKKVDPKNRDEFERQISRGKSWQQAMDRGKRAEDEKKWPEARAAYKDAEGVISNDKVGQAIARVDGEISKLYESACNDARAAVDQKNWGKARDLVTKAGAIHGEGSRHKGLDEDIRFGELLEKAEKAQKGGDTATAMSAAIDALKIRPSKEAQAILDAMKSGEAFQAAWAALTNGDRTTALKHARIAAGANPSSPDVPKLEQALWPELLAEKNKVAASGMVDHLLITKSGSIVGVGAGFTVWKADSLQESISAPATGTRLSGPVVMEKGEIQVVGILGTPTEDMSILPIAIWSKSGQKKLEIKFGENTIAISATRVAARGAETLLKIKWESGSRGAPDNYVLEVIDLNGKPISGGEPVIAPAQGHLCVANSPGLFATGGGIYRTYAGEKVQERKTDTQVYLWKPSPLGKDGIDLGESIGEDPILVFNHDASRLLVGTPLGKVFVIDVGRKSIVNTFTFTDRPDSISVAPDRSLAAVVSGGKVHFLDPDARWITVPPVFEGAKQVLFGKDGKSLYVGCDDQSLRRYAMEPLGSK